MKELTEVHALSVDDKQISFICPYCWSKYKKNGQPYMTAKRLIHYHGSNGNRANRIENRISHCSKHIYNGMFDIIIDDLTEKK